MLVTLITVFIVGPYTKNYYSCVVCCLLLFLERLAKIFVKSSIKVLAFFEKLSKMRKPNS